MGNGKMTRHHIIPRSRRRGADNGDNICFVGEDLHNKYHALFINKTPLEILDFLVNMFWGGKTCFIEQYAEELWEGRRKCG